MKPSFWRVEWQAHSDGTPAGFADYVERRKARGFYIIRKAAGFTVTIKPVWVYR